MSETVVVLLTFVLVSISATFLMMNEYGGKGGKLGGVCGGGGGGDGGRSGGNDGDGECGTGGVIGGRGLGALPGGCGGTKGGNDGLIGGEVGGSGLGGEVGGSGGGGDVGEVGGGQGGGDVGGVGGGQDGGDVCPPDGGGDVCPPDGGGGRGTICLGCVGDGGGNDGSGMTGGESTSLLGIEVAKYIPVPTPAATKIENIKQIIIFLVLLFVSFTFLLGCIVILTPGSETVVGGLFFITFLSLFIFSRLSRISCALLMDKGFELLLIFLISTSLGIGNELLLLLVFDKISVEFCIIEFAILTTFFSLEPSELDVLDSCVRLREFPDICELAS